MGLDGREQFSIAEDERFGFRHLDPVPSAEFLEQFYGQRYMELMDAGGRAPELRRLLQGGAERENELAWLRRSFYADIAHLLDEAAPGRRGRVLDIGAGTGDFLGYLNEQGWRAEGLEPSKLAAERAKDEGLTVHHGTLEGFVAQGEQRRYQAVTMLNVLEHVPDPVAFLGLVRELLDPGGVLVLSVPNDFTPVQAAAVEALGLRQWWVAVPDHINYFTYESLERTLEGTGYEVAGRTGTFPMELLLLLGCDYVSTPGLGPDAHQRRIAFEAALPQDLRRSLYSALANCGIGRHCIVSARQRG